MERQKLTPTLSQTHHARYRLKAGDDDYWAPSNDLSSSAAAAAAVAPSASARQQSASASGAFFYALRATLISV